MFIFFFFYKRLAGFIIVYAFYFFLIRKENLRFKLARFQTVGYSSEIRDEINKTYSIITTTI